jgi:hypothetical protein
MNDRWEREKAPSDRAEDPREIEKVNAVIGWPSASST